MTRENVMRVGHFLFFYRQISQDLNMLQNSFGHTIERRCRCESRTIRNKEFCADWFVWWNLLGGSGISFIYFHSRSGTELFPFTICVWKLERGVWGNVFGIVCMGLLSILIAFCIKHFCEV